MTEPGAAWAPPTREDITTAALTRGVPLTATDVALFTDMAATLSGAYNNVARWSAAHRPEPPDRPWTRPSSRSNPYNAWHVRGAITGDPGGILTGVTAAVKSNIAVAGWPLGAGSRLVDGRISVRDATVVASLLSAGATVVGTTNAEDLGLSGSSHTSAAGPVHNPWNTAHTTFGSSSGSAALVAAGLVGIALGADQAGSGRLPASGTGILGFKPTRGLLPYSGAMPFSSVQDHIAVMAANTTLLADTLRILSHRDGLDLRQGPAAMPIDWASTLHMGVSGLRIGIIREAFGTTVSHPAVNDTVLDACDQLASIGAQVSTVSIPEHTLGGDLAMVLTLQQGVPDLLEGNTGRATTSLATDPDLVDLFAARRAKHPQSLADTVRFAATAGAHTGGRPPGWWTATALNLSADLAAAYDRALAQFDVLVTPTAPYPPPVLPDAGTDRRRWISSALDMVANTGPFNLTGHPALSVPAGLAEGLPAGIQVIAAPTRDRRCLQVAQALQTLAGGSFPTPEPRTHTDHGALGSAISAPSS